MQDDPLREGPDPKSKPIEKSQGFFGLAGKSDVTLIISLSFVFTYGPYRGSSISALGRVVAFTPQREVPVIGGTCFDYLMDLQYLKHINSIALHRTLFSTVKLH